MRPNFALCIYKLFNEKADKWNVQNGDPFQKLSAMFAISFWEIGHAWTQNFVLHNHYSLCRCITFPKSTLREHLDFISNVNSLAHWTSGCFWSLGGGGKNWMTQVLTNPTDKRASPRNPCHRSPRSGLTYWSYDNIVEMSKLLWNYCEFRYQNLCIYY